ncbi:MAG: LysR family transcriptional regulator [Chlamydiota bacterium]
MRSFSDASQEAHFEELARQTMEHSLKNLRIADLELFISAARMHNLGKAALAHHLSQSAASAAVQRVEIAFREDLCTHERRQFRLTRKGQTLLPKFEEVVQSVRGLVASHDPPPIRLVTTHAIAAVAVPPLLCFDNMDFKHMRPDEAYAAIVQSEADMALVLDNAPWKGIVAAEVSRGYFQLYSRNKEAPLQPVLLPEEQMEVLFLQQTWLQVRGYALPIRARIPSWSLIGQICSATDGVGFLPDFLAKTHALHPVLWQPSPAPYRILAIYRGQERNLETRFSHIVHRLCAVFSEE